MKSVVVQAKTRKVRATWTRASIDDLEEMDWDVEIMNRLVRIVSLKKSGKARKAALKDLAAEYWSRSQKFRNIVNDRMIDVRNETQGLSQAEVDWFRSLRHEVRGAITGKELGVI